MRNCILVVGYSRPNFEAAQMEWLNYNVSLFSVATAQEAIERLKSQSYLAVIAAYSLSDLMILMETLRESRKIPLLILPQENSGAKMAESVLGEADTFIIDTDKLIESIKNNQEIVDHISQLSPKNKHLLGVLTHRDIFMMVKCRKVYIRESEIALSRSEFDILQLLLSEAGRVFTYEQLYLKAYGNDVSATITNNAVRCHMSRIRRSLRTENEPENYIVSVRSVGYQIAI